MKLQRSNDKMVRLSSIQWVSDTNYDTDDQKEKYQALRSCIKDLNDADQSIVVLYLEELPYKEIATVTGLTENHIAVKMKRIRKKLFDCISQKIG
jgi:RNA polymerase sigma-70 factor (ECF subfamily)